MRSLAVFGRAEQGLQGPEDFSMGTAGMYCNFFEKAGRSVFLLQSLWPRASAINQHRFYMTNGGKIISNAHNQQEPKLGDQLKEMKEMAAAESGSYQPVPEN
jgi:hypothetical protein